MNSAMTKTVATTSKTDADANGWTFAFPVGKERNLPDFYIGRKRFGFDGTDWVQVSEPRKARKSR
jgi:hypothetical protein